VVTNMIQTQLHLQVSWELPSSVEDGQWYTFILSPAEICGHCYCEEEKHFAGAVESELPGP